MPDELQDVAAGEVTRLLAALREGDRSALDALVPLLYGQLRTLARHQRRRAPADALNTTALVHEAYLKLSASVPLALENRRHFLAVAARAMRQIVVDHARAVVAQKRGSGVVHVPIDEVPLPLAEQAHDVVALSDALDRLEVADGELARLVELRFFAGLSVEETADALQVSPRTVKRHWRRARAFLYDAIAAT